MQPLLADRVGLKPRITEGLSGRRVSLRRSRERETRRIFGNGRRTLAATPAPKRKTRFGPPVGGRCPCPRSLKASRKTSPWRRVRPFPGYGACRFRRTCAVKRMAEAVSTFSPVKTRRLPCACSVCRGKASVSRSGPAVSTLIRKVSGLPRYRPGRFMGKAAMTNAGSLAGMWRCVSPHVFAIVTARSGSLLSALRAHGAVDRDPQGS